MQLSAPFLLYAMAIFCVIMGLPALFFPQKFNKVVGELLQNTVNIRILSFWNLVLSLIFLGTFWQLDGTWNMTVSILGWAMLLKGIVGLRRPQYPIFKYKKIFGTSDISVMILGLLCLAIAIMLGYWAMYNF